MTKKTEDKQENKSDGDSEKDLSRTYVYELLQDSIWKIAFIRDVALAHAMNADEDHVGITPEGEQGLGLILSSVGCDLEKVYDNM
jgi:hypothetical protein